VLSKRDPLASVGHVSPDEGITRRFHILGFGHGGVSLRLATTGHASRGPLDTRLSFAPVTPASVSVAARRRDKEWGYISGLKPGGIARGFHIPRFGPGGIKQMGGHPWWGCRPINAVFTRMRGVWRRKY
jgi:hypothetical protein